MSSRISRVYAALPAQDLPWPNPSSRPSPARKATTRRSRTAPSSRKTFEFEFEEVDPLIAAFRRMVRGNEFDICEMAITTYICAKAHGKPMTAVPIFLVRAFHHGAILVNTKAGIRTPKDLEGRKVGVNRGYTVTTGVWARSILQEEHGVDLEQDHLGALRRRARGRVPAARQRGADRAGQEDGGHAGVGRARRRHRRRGGRARRGAAHSRCARGGARGAAPARPLSDQPYRGDQGRADRRSIRDLAADVFDAFAAIEAPSTSSASRAGRSRSRPRWTRCTGG